MSEELREIHINPGQMMLSGYGPAVGERWRNRSTGAICAVLAIDQCHYAWVTIRLHGEPSMLRLDRFERYYERI